jgi:hypothetical protein
MLVLVLLPVLLPVLLVLLIVVALGDLDVVLVLHGVLRCGTVACCALSPPSE